MNKGYKLQLDFVLGIHNPTMRFDEYDENVQDFYITLTKNDEIVENVANALVVLVAIKPDKSVEAQFLNIDEGLVYGKLNPNMRDQVGRYEAKAMIVMDKDVTITGPIYYIVTEDYVVEAFEDSVVNSDEYRIINEILIRLADIETTEDIRVETFDRMLKELNEALSAFDGEELHGHLNKEVLDAITTDMLEKLQNIPTKVSDLVNDANFVTEAQANQIAEDTLNLSQVYTDDKFAEAKDLIDEGVATSKAYTDKALEKHSIPESTLNSLATKDEVNQVKFDVQNLSTDLSKNYSILDGKINNKCYELDVKLTNNINQLENRVDNKIQNVHDALSDKANNLFQSNSSIVQAFGGLSEGDIVNNKSLQDLLSQLLFPYVEPTIEVSYRFSPKQDFYEVGQTVEITHIDFFIHKKSEFIKKIDVLQNSRTLKSYTESISGGGQYVYTFDEPLLITKSISSSYLQVQATDMKDTTVLENTSPIIFNYPIYFGGIGRGVEINKNIIQFLTKDITGKSDKDYVFNLANQRVIFAYPQYYGDLSIIRDKNGFDITNAFTKFELVLLCGDNSELIYNVYVNDASTVKDFNIKFYF